MTLFTWSQTAASNNTADSTINLREGQAPSTVNNSVRAIMAAAAKWRDDLSGALNTAGSSTAYTITTNQTYTSLSDGISVTARVHTTSGATPTLNVDSLGAKDIYIYSSQAVPTGGLLGGGIYRFTYDSGDDVWYVHSFHAQVDVIESSTVMLFVQTSAPTGWTKSTSHNDKALRIVSGSASSGGSVAFATAFASKTPTGTIGGTSLTEAQLPSHSHKLFQSGSSGGSSGSVGSTDIVEASHNYGNSNTYSLNGESGTATLGQTSAIGSGSTHTHSFTGDAINLAVQYVDCIIATRD